MKKLLSFVLCFCCISSFLYAQSPEYKKISVPVAGYSRAVADFNNDGLLDIWQEWGDYKNGNLIKNQGNRTFIKPIGSNTVNWLGGGIVFFNDLDNDGDVDFLGIRDNIVTAINNGDGTMNYSILGKNTISQACLSDLNNNGLLDILTLEASNGKYNVLIYNNEGKNKFTKKEILSATNFIQINAFDYDHDGKLDIILYDNKSTYFYQNKGNLNFVQKGSIENFYLGKPFDSNADGLMDILYTDGVYINQGNHHYEKKVTFNEGSKMMDIDNNGLLDIVSTCTFLNKGNTNFDGIVYLDLFADFDNDGRVDALMDYMNSDTNFYLYQNISSIANTPPTKPTNLIARSDADSIVFTWNRATDKETPNSGLTYNLRVSTSAGGCDILSPAALASGKRLIVQQGNTLNDTSFTLKGLPTGTYYWTVQAIDNSMEGSEFAPEQTMFFTNKIYHTNEVDLQVHRGDIQFVLEDMNPLDASQWKVGTKPGEYQDIEGVNGTTYTPTFHQVGTYYLMCESRRNNAKIYSNVVKINVFNPEIVITSSIPDCFISRQKGCTFSLDYNLIGVYESDNQFTAYLSDKNGIFSNEIKLNSLVSNSYGVFTVNLPEGIPDGSGYKIRLKSTNPQVISKPSTNFTIELNDAPINITLINSYISENEDIGTNVGTLQAIDLDSEDTFTYTSLTNSTNFILVGNTLKTNRIFDYETEPTIYTFAIKATDQHNTFCIRTFNISIDNVNEPPTLRLPSQTFSGNELSDISVNGFIISDIDSYERNLQITISSDNGILKFNDLKDNELFTGKRSSSLIDIRSTLKRVNEIINSLIFSSNRFFYGQAQIKIVVSDMGNTGRGNVETVESILTLNIVPLPPEITVQPISEIKGCINTQVVFSISVDAAKPIEYQWFKDGGMLYGEKNSFIRIDVKNIENSGSYYCKIKNLGGEVMSNQGVLLVKPQQMSTQIENITSCAGDRAGEISVTAAGGWDDSYTYSIDSEHFISTNLFKKLVGGTYTVSVKDANNCITSKEFLVQTPPLLKPNVTVKNSSCSAYNNGELLINAVGGTPPFSLDIQSSSINEKLNFDSNLSNKLYKNLIPDIYTINIKDKNSCDTFAVIRITEPEKLSFTTKTCSVTCYGDSNGELNFSLNGGTQPYYFYWANKQMTNLVKDFKSGTYNLSDVAKTTGLPAGTYDFYIVDSQNCETSENVEIPTPKPLEISFVDNTLIAKGGTFPYEYSENGRSFSITNTFPNLTNGLHTLTIRDSKACMNSINQYIDNKIVTIEKPKIDFSFSSKGSKVDLSSSIQNASFWVWDFGDGTVSSEKVSNYTYSKSGTYNITLTAYNESGSSVIKKTITIITTNTTIETESDFILYPNPTEDEVFITCSTNKSLIISVFDASGRKVLETKNLHFSVKNLAKGFYTVKIGTTSKKLIIR